MILMAILTALRQKNISTPLFHESCSYFPITVLSPPPLLHLVVISFPIQTSRFAPFGNDVFFKHSYNHVGSCMAHNHMCAGDLLVVVKRPVEILAGRQILQGKQTQYTSIGLRLTVQRT